MTKKELIQQISDYRDDDPVVIEVHDYTAHEDLYDFYVDPIKLDEDYTEIRLTIIPN